MLTFGSVRVLGSNRGMMFTPFGPGPPVGSCSTDNSDKVSMTAVNSTFEKLTRGIRIARIFASSGFSPSISMP
ncbi:MAG: hypothetical protein BWY82_01936 [Verrucomicrobia bacterium ADurb.Bin474]|nr:MAG: hypothetical protein BWY82_01936 [Verrucomicrobia bacterium ADurb.Bin474]